MGEISELAHSCGVQLVIVDPELLQIIDFIDGSKSEIDDDAVVVFSKSSIDSRLSQEPRTHKSIIHIAAINETSGGQPNLKIFYNLLRRSGYTVKRYDDTSETMQPEVYTRPIHLFDDDDSQLLGKVKEPIIMSQVGGEEVSKIYTEFIAHLLILNKTSADMSSGPRSNVRFPILHIMILYNYEYQPEQAWIQSSLDLDEKEKHQLLAYGLHVMDFRLPLEKNYIHQKKPMVRLRTGKSDYSWVESSLKHYWLFETNDLLHYVNNSYAHCKRSMFNITGLINSSRRLSNYMLTLDESLPIDDASSREAILGQAMSAFQLMSIISKAYGGLSYWITGSTLLAYHKFCDVLLAPQTNRVDRFPRYQLKKRSQGKESSNFLENSTEFFIDLEFGMFTDELNKSILSELADSEKIGIEMVSDWRKPGGHISFQISQCPNIVMNIYPYELKRDFYQYYYVTRNSMILNHKSKRRRSHGSILEDAGSSIIGEHHHVFTTRNLELCSTRIDRFHPFKIPCDVHDHLRRIYVV